jgi:multisubunit Na+/H+ antiporter MnhC subunit
MKTFIHIQAVFMSMLLASMKVVMLLSLLDGALMLMVLSTGSARINGVLSGETKASLTLKQEKLASIQSP